MASSICKSAATAGTRSVVAIRTKATLPRTLKPKSIPSLCPPTTRITPCLSRIAMALGSTESLMPLHTAIATARLKSILAESSSCWSWLSQDFAVPR